MIVKLFFLKKYTISITIGTQLDLKEMEHCGLSEYEKTRFVSTYNKIKCEEMISLSCHLLLHNVTIIK